MARKRILFSKSRKGPKARKKAAGEKKNNAGKSKNRSQGKAESSSRRLPPLLLLFTWPILLVNWLTKSLRPAFKWPVRLAGYGMAAGGVLFVFGAIFFSLQALRFDMKEVAQMPARTEILDRNGSILRNAEGKEIGFLHGKNRHLVTYDEVAPVFIDALIAREDGRFREHGAMDMRSVGRVLLRLVTRGKLEGGSTLTMQLARNSFDLKSRNETVVSGINRKFLEIALAFRIERNFSKNEIIEHYVNRIFWGHTIRGVGAASRTYFEKPASQLSLSEAALLAGIIRGPNAFSPFKSLEKATRERDTTLDRMVYFGLLDEATAALTKAKSVTLPPGAKKIPEGSYALDAIRRDLDRVLEENNIKNGGLVIRTTIDPAVQKITEQAVESSLQNLERRRDYQHPVRADFQNGEPEYVQGAAVVIDNSTGGVLAVVGGRSARESAYNRAVQARRPIASTFKPFIFLAAVEAGMPPNAPVSDQPLRPGEIRGASRSWNPKNSDGRNYGNLPASRALIDSRNTPMIRVADRAGMANVIETARQVGFEAQNIPQDATSYLGTWGATVEQVASAYTIFPNGGVRYRPYYVQSIEDQNGNVLFTSGPIPYRAALEQPAWETSAVLQEVNKRGTGREIRTRYGFTKPSAGKTGTTNDYHDAWYAGYTSDLTCAVWVGLDKPRRIANAGSGGRLAAPIWAEVMKRSHILTAYNARPLVPKPTTALVEDVPGVPMALPAENGAEMFQNAPDEPPARAEVVRPEKPRQGPKSQPRPRQIPRAEPVIPRAEPVIPRAEPVIPRAEPVR